MLLKRYKKWFQILALSLLSFFQNSVQAAVEEAPCGVVLKLGTGVHVIPAVGRVQSRFVENGPIGCASSIITRQDPFWIRLIDQTVLKIAPQSFLEISKAGLNTFHLYRGNVLVSAPPGIKTQTWGTPNSELVFMGGIAFIQYKPSTRVTTASCFNRELQFRNKFNKNSGTTVHVGEMSHLAIQEANVSPSQPAVMSHASVVQALENLKLAGSDQEELVASVRRVYQDRAKSMTSEIESWDPEANPELERAPAEYADKKKSVKAIDPKEANFVSRKMHEHLYGEDQGRELGDEKNQRHPASTKGHPKLKDSIKDAQDESFKRESKRIEKKIEQISDEDGTPE